MGWDLYAWSHPVLLMPHAVMWDYGLWRMPCAWWRMCPFLPSNPPPVTEWSPEGCPAFLPSPTTMFAYLLHQGKGCQSVGNLFVHKMSLKRKHCKKVGKTKTSCKGECEDIHYIICHRSILYRATDWEERMSQKNNFKLWYFTGRKMTTNPTLN